MQLRLPAVIHMTDEFRAMIDQFAPITRQAFESVRAMSAADQQQRSAS